jgi:hypothetical protein
VSTISTDFNVKDQLPITYFAFLTYCRKRGFNGTILQLLIDFEKAYDSVNREVLCNILTGFGIPMKLVWPIKIY